MISFKEFEALILDCIWRNKVGMLLGPEWDNEGSHLVDTMLNECLITWGDAGVDLISDFVDWQIGEGMAPELYVSDTAKVWATTIEELWEMLNTYCLMDDFDEEEA